MVYEHRIVIFGAGKIGRSFIGQLFGTAGYEVVFVDVDQDMVDMINLKGRYRVVSMGETMSETVISGVSAISAFDRQKVAEAVSVAGILAVSAGKFAMGKIMPDIAAGIMIRWQNDPERPLDIILAENMRSAAEFAGSVLSGCLPEGFPLESYVGLVETSIGKMVPMMPAAELEKDPLVVFAEPYNTLIVDRIGFRAPIPPIKGLAPKSNIKAWVDRKAFIHNLGHATAAWYGHYLHPGAIYMYDVLEDLEVERFTRAVMLQSAENLLTAWPGEFTMPELAEHIDDLIKRFKNKALRDTLFRVGHDLVRKLGPDDRFMGAIELANRIHSSYDLIVKAMSYAFFFRMNDESGTCYAPDIVFLDALQTDIKSALTEMLGYSTTEDLQVIDKLLQLYRETGRTN